MADQTLARYLNERSILTMLRTEGSASRADIARRLSLTPATITRLVTEMAGRGLVREVAGTAQAAIAREPGRPGVSIALNPAGAYFLGVEIGVGILRFALLDLAANLVSSAEAQVSKTITPAAVVKRIVAHVKKLVADDRFGDRIKSVGVTVPGLVTSDGFIVHLPILGWKNVDLQGMLDDAVHLPCIVENNGNAAAFGSVYTQPSSADGCTLFLKLGTGCGGAAIINGRLLRGGSGTAGEFGHIRVAEHGKCRGCGQTGCLEGFVDLVAVARSFRGTEALSDDAYARLPADLVEAALAGDQLASDAIGLFSHYLAQGIVTLVNIFNPTLIELGGVLRPVIGHCLLDVQTHVKAGIVPGTTVPEIQLSRLGLFECAIGAATVVHHHAFDISHVNLKVLEVQP